MMRKAMAIALFALAAATVKATPSTNTKSGSTGAEAQKQLTPIRPDTLIVSAATVNPLIFYQNLIFKRRLDSLQNAVPLSYNEHVQAYIDLFVFKRKEQIGKMLGLSKYYFPIFEKALNEVGIPEEIKFISVIESALNPHAVSRSGAVGPWQFMYTTAKGYGLKIDSYVDERKDPVAASYAAAVYFKDAYARFGDWLLAIAAYNCGSGAVSRAVARAGGNADFWQIRPYLPRETQNYVPAFIATVYAMNYHLKHDIYPRVADFNIVTDVIEVNRVVSLANIAKAADLNLKELGILNPSYKKQIINGSVSLPKRLVIPMVDNQVFASLYNVLNGTKEAYNPQIIAANFGGDASADKPNAVSHKVRPGEDLNSIANRFGIEVQDIKVWNNLKSTPIVPGQTLKIQPPNPAKQVAETPQYFTYKVKIGDSLSKIAERFEGATVSKIKALNGLTKSILSPGMLLKIYKL